MGKQSLRKPEWFAWAAENLGLAGPYLEPRPFATCPLLCGLRMAASPRVLDPGATGGVKQVPSTLPCFFLLWP